MNLTFDSIGDIAIAKYEDKNCEMKYLILGFLSKFVFQGKCKSRRSFRVASKRLVKLGGAE